MRRKNRNARKPTILSGKVIVIAIASCFTGFLYANPIAPTVISGNASFQTLGKTLNVTNTPGAIIQWNGFSIASNEITRFIQQSASSSVLNRVMGTDASNLLGQLLSTGKVFLINPNGVFVGGGAIIDTAGFVASSLRLSDSDFLSGKFKFEEHIGAAKIVNHGSISANGGPVYLVAPNVENHGVITSPTGEIILAAGKSVELVQAASPNLRVELTAGEFEALNVGKLIASSGRVGIFGTTVRNSGTVSASGASIDAASGKIFLRAKKDVTLEATSVVTANGGQGGEVTIQAGEKSAGGTLLADGAIEAKGSVAKGGMVQMLGDRVGLIGNARVDASGDAGGGTVLVGGDFQGKNSEIQNAERTFVGSGAIISADAGTNGDGGKVIVWADESTQFFGSIAARGGAISGDGGNAEISGKRFLNARIGKVFLGAVNGKAGTLLLDPADIVINGGTTDGSDSEAGNSATLVQQNGGNAGEVLFADTPTTYNIFESEIENTDADINLQATNSISVTGTFTVDTNGEGAGSIVRLKNNRSLTLDTRNATGEGTTGISLTGVAFQTLGSGNITVRSGITGAGAGGDGATPVTVSALTALGTGNVLLHANGNISVNGTITTTTGGTVTFTNAGLLTVNGNISSDGAVVQNGAGAVTITAPRTITTTGDAVSFATAVSLNGGAAGLVSVDTTNAGGSDLEQRCHDQHHG